MKLFVLFGLFMTGAAFGQSSSLQGVVSDGQGEIIPDAVITIVNLSTAATRKIVSSGNGAYSFVQVPPGTYKLEAVKPGFRTLSQQVRLQIDVPATINLALEVGQVSETINVTEEVAS